MLHRNFQDILFENIKSRIDDSQSLIDHLVDILDISKDSGYRRIRGETALSFDESVKLARHFRISLNEVAGQAENSAVFLRQPFINTVDDYLDYMRRTVETLSRIKDMKGHQMLYSAKDIPIFYQFAFPKLTAFKIYVWLKSIYNIQTINDKYYSIDDIPEEFLKLASEQWSLFSQINTIEIWNDTTILSLLNQISYYYEAGLLSSREEALEICDQFQELLKLVYKQAVNGKKVHANNSEVFSGASCKMYYHEVLIMDNHILVESGNDKLWYFIPYAGLNFMSTIDPEMNLQIDHYIKGQIAKSALLSDVSEKDRNKFFFRMKSKVDQLKEKINSTDPFS